VQTPELVTQELETHVQGGCQMKQAILVSVILLLAAGTQVGIGQSVHRLPFASTDNSIELTVANTSTLPLVGVTVEATGLPS
jgi:hypothetical protein